MFQHWLEGVENSSKSRKFGTVTTHQSIPAVPLPHSRPISRHEHLKKNWEIPRNGDKKMSRPRAHPENNSYKFNQSSLFCMPEPVQKVSCYYSKKSLRSKFAHFSIVLHTYSTGQRYCSTYTRVKCAQYGGFTRALHAKYTRVIFYTNCYTNLNYTKFCVYLEQRQTLESIHALCVYSSASNVHVLKKYRR